LGRDAAPRTFDTSDASWRIKSMSSCVDDEKRLRRDVMTVLAMAPSRTAATNTNTAPRT
jgi:hypothetical protein